MEKLEEIFNDTKYYNDYLECHNKSTALLDSCKKLFEINNFMDLDKSVEHTLEAKIGIDHCLAILENIFTINHIELAPMKDDLKYNGLIFEIKYDTMFKEQRLDMTVKDFEKRRERAKIQEQKKNMEELRNLEANLEILKMEIKQIERLREAINDEYLSLKKKYDAMIKFGNV